MLENSRDYIIVGIGGLCWGMSVPYTVECIFDNKPIRPFRNNNVATKILVGGLIGVLLSIGSYTFFINST